LSALDGGDDIPIEEDANTFESELGAPSLSAPAAVPTGVPSVPLASFPGNAAETASDRSVASRIIRERSVVERTSPVSPVHASTPPTPAMVVPPVPVGSPFAPPEASSSDPEQASPHASASPATALAPAPKGNGTRTTITTAAAGTGAPADFASALQGALSRVEAWMRREPRAPHNESGVASSASPGHAAGASAFAPAPLSDAPPRLSIGRIDVEVVSPPMAPPPIRSVTQVVAVAAAAPRPDNLGRFGFGMRQR
jgi:hypothetical protein